MAFKMEYEFTLPKGYIDENGICIARDYETSRSG